MVSILNDSVPVTTRSLIPASFCHFTSRLFVSKSMRQGSIEYGHCGSMNILSSCDYASLGRVTIKISSPSRWMTLPMRLLKTRRTSQSSACRAMHPRSRTIRAAPRNLLKKCQCVGLAVYIAFFLNKCEVGEAHSEDATTARGAHSDTIQR